MALATPMGSRPCGKLANKSLLLRRGLQLLAKGVTSAESTTDHMTLCSYVHWGGGSCPQTTIARVKYRPSGYLIKTALLESAPVSCSGKASGRELKIKRYLTPITEMVSCYYKASKLWWGRTGHIPQLAFLSPLNLIQDYSAV